MKLLMEQFGFLQSIPNAYKENKPDAFNDFSLVNQDFFSYYSSLFFFCDSKILVPLRGKLLHLYRNKFYLQKMRHCNSC